MAERAQAFASRKRSERVLGPVAVVAAGGRRAARGRRSGRRARFRCSVMFGLAAMLARVSAVMRTKGSSSAWRISVGTAMRSSDARGGGAVVVVVGAGEAGVERGDAVVELAQRADAGGAVADRRRGGRARPCGGSGAAERGGTSARRGGFAGRCSASAEGPRSTTGETPTTERSSRRRCVAEFAGELEDEVAAHGVADERDGSQALALDEEAA